MRASAWDRFAKGSSREGPRVSVLVCTDLAARGLDIAGVQCAVCGNCSLGGVQVEHVVNFDFPQTLVQYVHRAGRMGR